MRHPFRLAAANLSAPSAGRAGRAANRALLFAGALLLLWLAVSVMPSPSGPAPSATEAPATDAGTVAAHPPLPQRTPPSLFRPGTVIAGLLLAGGVGFAVWLRRRQAPGGPDGHVLSTVGSLALGANQQLRLVRCGGEVLLLGVSAGEVRLLKTYPADAFHAPGGDGAATPAFADLLRTVAPPTRNA